MIKIHIEDFRIKMALVTALSLLVFLFIFILLGYTYDFNALRETTGISHKEMARLLADGISNIVNKEIELMKSSASSDIIYEAVRDADSKYGADEKANSRFLEDMDKKWIESSDGHSLIKEYLENRVAVKLKTALGQEGKIVNLLVTDKFGGLVGATARTPDFYQGNKDWWKGAYADGDGRPYVGNVVYNEKLNIWCVPFAVPIKDKSGDVLGVYRSLIDIKAFFNGLEDFKIGETGWASLVDDKCYLIYQQGAKPFANKFCNYEELRKVQESKRSSFVMDGIYARSSKVFVSFADVNNKLLNDGGIKWSVFVTQEAREVFSPLNRTLLQTLVIGIILVLLLAAVAFITADIFMGPIRRMKDGIDRIARGELDYRIQSDNERQLKGLADSINAMVVNLKTWAAPLANLDKEIYLRKKAEEKLNNITSGFVWALSGLKRHIENIKEWFALSRNEMPKTLNEKQKKSADAVEESVEVVSGELGKLLDIATIETGKVELNKKVVDIRTLLRDVIFVFEPKVRDKGLDFKMEAPKEAVNILADSDKIMKVFNNLMENAVKFTEKGHIELVVRELRDDVECSVIDTGPGIPKDAIFNVFDKFQKVGKNPGTSPGVGLAIAKEIVDMHNGKIWVESKPNESTKFTFRLPKYKKESVF